MDIFNFKPNNVAKFLESDEIRLISQADIDNKRIEAIPLTENCLIILGFEKYDLGELFAYRKEVSKDQYIYSSFCSNKELYVSCEFSGVEMTAVHHVQNYYVTFLKMPLIPPLAPRHFSSPFLALDDSMDYPATVYKKEDDGKFYRYNFNQLAAEKMNFMYNLEIGMLMEAPPDCDCKAGHNDFMSAMNESIESKKNGIIRYEGCKFSTMIELTVITDKGDVYLRIVVMKVKFREESLCSTPNQVPQYQTPPQA